jgi:hypothetical protein
MCKLCGINTDEHPPGCCNFANLVRMSQGGEPMPMHPIDMGVTPPRGRTYLAPKLFGKSKIEGKK